MMVGAKENPWYQNRIKKAKMPYLHNYYDNTSKKYVNHLFHFSVSSYQYGLFLVDEQPVIVI